MTWMPPDDEDASDRERRQRAGAAHRRKLLDALYDRSGAGQYLSRLDWGFVIGLRKSDLVLISDDDRLRLDRLVWTHRRTLPDGLRPKLPPHDPIVRELEGAHG